MASDKLIQEVSEHQQETMRKAKKSVNNEAISTALAAVALQDHLIRSLSLDLSRRPLLTQHKAPSTSLHSHSDKAASSISRISHSDTSKCENQREYVLDRKPPPLTLAQKLGLVEAPRQLLTEDDWKKVKEKACNRQDFNQPCVICKEDLGLQPHVLLSCTHVFHKNCLQSFERFTGRKSCPMCRKEQYETRVVHEGVKHMREKSATIIQATWRGYVVRCWYCKLRQTVPPKDPKLRCKFYEEKLKSITDRMLKSLDYDVNGFLGEIDRSLEASRNVFKHFDNMVRVISDVDWQTIEAKALERGDTDCPICLMRLDAIADILPANHGQCGDSCSSNRISQSGSTANQASHAGVSSTNRGAATQAQNRKLATPAKPKHRTCNPATTSSGSHPRLLDDTNKTLSTSATNCDVSTPRKRSVIVLSCSHVFHTTCLRALEEFSCGEGRSTCPVCRSHYQTKIIDKKMILN